MFNKIIILLMFVLFLLSCGDKKGDSKDDVIKIKLAHDNSVTASGHLGLLEFKRIVEEKSDGKITVTIYPGGQMGDLNTIFELTRRGDLEMSVGDPGLISQTIPEYALWSLFYLFDSYEHAHAFMDGPVAKKMLEYINHFNVTGLGYLEAFGFRNLSNNKKEVRYAEDIKGLKLRGYNPTQIKGWEATGSHLSVINWTELFTSLQQNLIDGQESATASFYEQRFYETQKYFTLTQHIYTSWVWYVNTDFYNELSDEYRNIINEAVEETRHMQREISIDKENNALKKIADYGIVITEFPLEQKNILREKMNAAIVDIIIDESGKEIYDEFMKGVEDSRETL